MIRILMVGPESGPLNGVAEVIVSHGDIELVRSPDAAETLKAVARQHFDLVVAGEYLEDMVGLDLIRKVVAVDPMANSAAVSGLSSEAFHEATEGLGVLMQLQPSAGADQAADLLQRLKGVLRLTAAKPAAV